ncbi:Putative Zinc finger, RING-type, Zinc finger, CHY-type, Zinc finger, RING/FYVE/PHD-type [Septoria linicola]|uniref:Zinc finger, RING-type, Zinc finger, CHY-type, Zinc finger, RING/FYVE/PHD-type n=1 Tax=Septoria linicola TaxID=215465 RepID=A0A9Q9B6B1_9PEZI|nr:putative Zinc finger, RING-type, Zinc finger, CHY-type, Zinc finger, RING/FYVE/PHD-type [Septoria linicola]USW58258.1 Putative Zinc finger, RING-type, Zinc finger, CHY-type, Zinc finger, RING/FYVE/PHD-type [Septoria linicola]
MSDSVRRVPDQDVLECDATRPGSGSGPEHRRRQNDAALASRESLGTIRRGSATHHTIWQQAEIVGNDGRQYSTIAEDGQQQTRDILIGSREGQYAAERPARPAHGVLPTTFNERMSINPAHDIEEILRSAVNSSLATPDASPLERSTVDLEQTEEERLAAIAHMHFNVANTANMDGALPEDDGMRSLRQKLQEIKELAVSTEEKAKRMHLLMMQDYAKHRDLGHLTPPDSPGPRGHDSDGLESPLLGAAAHPIDPQNPYNLRPGDLEPVFSPLPKAARDVDLDDDEAIIDDDDFDMGCMHYKRNVKVQCFDCQRWFPCRHCHDQSKDLPFPHALNRQKTQNMLCMICQTPQAASQECVNCGNYAAWYYCSKCKLWDNDTNKRIYHCDDCGICRVGEGLGKDFVHCKRCNVCISISTSAAHPCIERATEGNCPLCLMRMFEAKVPVVSLPCGHYMHGDCYKDLMAVTYRCPVCSKSAVNMELQWRKLDEEIAIQPMPEDEDLEGLLSQGEGAEQQPEQVADTNDATYASPPRRPRTVWIGCNDCGARTWTPFHWLGLKCQRCDSYNTNQFTPTAHHETEAERLLRQQTQSIRRHDFTGNEVLRDAGIGMSDEAAEVPPSALEVPESPSQQPLPSSSPYLAAGAQSPGRYFVTDEEVRRPSFSGRFSAPSMPNLPTLSNLPDIPRMPRMPTLPNMPNLQNMRQNFPNMPNMPNVELSRFSPYEMMDAVSRSLSPMRYYLRGLDIADGEEDLPQHLNVRGAVSGSGVIHRPGSVQSDSAIPRRGSKLRSSSAADSVDIFASGRAGDDYADEDEAVQDSSEDDSAEDDSGEEDMDDEDEDENNDTEMIDDADDPPGLAGKKDKLEFEIFGHR